MTKEDVFLKIKEILAAEFEIDPALITPEAHLYKELELDSIDAVDLLVKMKQYVPGTINPEMFKKALTIQDVVDILHALIQSP